MKRAAVPTLFIALFVFFIFGPTVPVHAQLVFPGTGADLSLDATPLYPGPNANVQLSLRSVLLDLSGSDITWYVNGTVIKNGVGESKATVRTGSLGTETSVRVDATSGATTASAKGVFRPTETDLLWEANTYVPPFYHGRALPSAGSTVRLFAVPRFKRIGNTSFVPTEELIYTWKKNNKIVQSASGRGKNSALIEMSGISSSDTVTVEVKTADGALQGSSSVNIPVVEPSLVLYENHPVFGILYHRALEGVASVPEAETTFSVVPYFAATENPDNGSLVYKWSVNNSLVASSETRPSSITINAEGTDGVALIQLAVTRVGNFFMNTRKAWSVTLAGTDISSVQNSFTDPFTNGNNK